MNWRRPAVTLASCCFITSCARVGHRAAADPFRDWRPAEVRNVKNAQRLADGDLELERLRQRVIEQPTDTAARRQLAARYEELGFAELAIEHYRLAGEKNPGDELAVYRHACAARAQDPASARRELRRYATRYTVRRADTYSLLGILDDQAGELALGESMHREALRLEPKSPALHNNLGFNLLTQGRPQEAVDSFRHALRLSPGSALARNNMATAIAAIVESEPSNESAVRLAFSHWKKAAGVAEAHNNLAAVYMKQGRYAEARRELEQAVYQQPDLAPAWRNLQQLSALDGGKPLVGPPSGRAAKAWRTLSERPSGSRSGTPVPKPEPVTNRTEGEGPEKSLRETIGSGSEAADAKE